MSTVTDAPRHGDTLDCGHTLVTPERTRRTGCGGTGYATYPDGLTTCYPCADADERTRVADPTTSVFVAYVSGDGRSVTTWTGGILARVIDARTLRRVGWHATDLLYIRARAPDGSEWYGRGVGRCMCINMRRAKGGAR